MKLVAGAETPHRVFAAATRLLEWTVCAVCQESLVSELSEEVEELRRGLADISRVQTQVPVPERFGSSKSRPAHPDNLTLVNNALRYLHQNYQRPGLSLPAIAEVLRCNPRYLTTRFTAIVGERMHSYLLRLRVAHACRLLIGTDVPIKQIAYCSGFHDNAALARVFRCSVGVSPLEYRRIFGTEVSDQRPIHGNVPTPAPVGKRADSRESSASDSGPRPESPRGGPEPDEASGQSARRPAQWSYHRRRPAGAPGPGALGEIDDAFDVLARAEEGHLRR